jgi:hypothetical protein
MLLQNECTSMLELLAKLKNLGKLQEGAAFPPRPEGRGFYAGMK